LNQPLRLPTHTWNLRNPEDADIDRRERIRRDVAGTVVHKNADARWNSMSLRTIWMSGARRWLDPGAPRLLARFTGAGESTADISRRDAAVARIAARGRLRASEIVLAPLRFENSTARRTGGRTDHNSQGAGGFLRRKSVGHVECPVARRPILPISRALERWMLRGWFAPCFAQHPSCGTASATLTLTAHGVGRANLVRSMEGDGQTGRANVNSAEWICEPDFRDAQDSSPGGSRPRKEISALVVAESRWRISSWTIRKAASSEAALFFSRAEPAHSIRRFSCHNKPGKRAAAKFILGGTIESPSVALLLRPRNRLPNLSPARGSIAMLARVVCPPSLVGQASCLSLTCDRIVRTDRVLSYPAQ